MTTLIQQIEDMRVHVNEMTNAEQRLVQALGDALNRADQKLLHEVRNIASEHELRRSVIFKELQAMAARVGVLSDSSEPSAVLKITPREVPTVPVQRDDRKASHLGNWQQAANIQDELDFHLKRRAY